MDDEEYVIGLEFDSYDLEFHASVVISEPQELRIFVVLEGQGGREVIVDHVQGVRPPDAVLAGRLGEPEAHPGNFAPQNYARQGVA
ncbi:MULTISPECIES: hypothetical protein [Saccharothrix]|uniref:hypothetical protein n=1 Tax=Saccharothrix TaxID=2071 RepID=UPI00116152EE|nr:hypothetical protein [Saccharothrix sp. CB00851]